MHFFSFSIPLRGKPSLPPELEVGRNCILHRSEMRTSRPILRIGAEVAAFSCADGSVRLLQLQSKRLKLTDRNSCDGLCRRVVGCNGQWLCSNGKSVVPCRMTQAEQRKSSAKISANFNLADQVVIII